MAGPWHLAVDFGTSNSAAAHTNPFGGAVEAVALSHRSNFMPSAVFVNPDGETVISGDGALIAGRRDPSRLVLSPKRFIDHDIIQLEGDDVPSQAIFSAVIREIIDRAAEHHGGEWPKSLTLTHPERWSHAALGNLVEAAQAAGAEVGQLRTISEPRAAAIHYAAQQRVAPGNHVAVFDFGGGTLDIAVLRAEQNGDYRVVAAKGDNSLGGRTVDNLVFRWVIDQVDHDDPDLADALRNARPSVMHTLQSNIREAKELLSDTSSATITISTPAGEQDVLITRDEFNTIISKPIERAAEMTEAVLREAGVDGFETTIYLTGGSSRIPYVQDQLGKVGRVMRLDDPKTVVSRGALAATLRGFTAPAEPRRHPRRADAGATVNPFSSRAEARQPREVQPEAPRKQPPAPRPEPVQPSQQPSMGAPERALQQRPTSEPSRSPSTPNNTQKPSTTSAVSTPSTSPVASSPTPASASTPSIAPAAETKRSKNPVIAGLAIAGVALLAGIGWWVLSGDEGADTDTDVVQPQETVAEQQENAGEEQAPAPAAGFVPIDGALADASFLPQALLEASGPTSCQLPPKQASTYTEFNWLEGSDAQATRCALVVENASYGAFFVTGENAEKLLEQFNALEDVRQLDGNQPTIYVRNKDGMQRNDLIAHYPAQQTIVVSTIFVDGDSQAVATEWAQQLGFR